MLLKYRRYTVGWLEEKILNKLAVAVERMGLFSYWGFAPALCSVSC